MKQSKTSSTLGCMWVGLLEIKLPARVRLFILSIIRISIALYVAGHVEDRQDIYSGRECGRKDSLVLLCMQNAGRYRWAAGKERRKKWQSDKDCQESMQHVSVKRTNASWVHFAGCNHKMYRFAIYCEGARERQRERQRERRGKELFGIRVGKLSALGIVPDGHKPLPPFINSLWLLPLLPSPLC